MSDVFLEGVEYTEDEAKQLRSWLLDPSFGLLDRYFELVREQSVDMMDDGRAGMDDLEYLVQNSAIRRVIRDIRTYANRLDEAMMQPDSEPESESVDN